MQKGFFAYPTYSVQGQKVDVKSQSQQTPIDAAGSRIEYTDICFINEGTNNYSGAQGNTIALQGALLNTSHEIVSGGFNADSNQLQNGSKAIRFLPKINSIKIDIAGQDYPSSSTYDGLGNNPDVGYKLYKEMFEEDERKIAYRDWIFRYNKM